MLSLLFTAIAIDAAPATMNATAPANATEWCCSWCSAGGCSAQYSPSNMNVPIDAGECIHGGSITPIPNHGNNCGDPTYCCTCCSAGGCSAWYSIKDEQPGGDCGCSKGEYISPIPNHGQTCKAPPPSSPSALLNESLVVEHA